MKNPRNPFSYSSHNLGERVREIIDEELSSMFGGYIANDGEWDAFGDMDTSLFYFDNRTGRQIYPDLEDSDTIVGSLRITKMPDGLFDVFKFFEVRDEEGEGEYIAEQYRHFESKGKEKTASDIAAWAASPIEDMR